MRFFTAATFFLAATAAPLDQNQNKESTQVEKRVIDPVSLFILTSAGTAAATWATTEGLNSLKGLIKDLSTWDKVRQEFTVDAVDAMIKKIGADPSFKGAVCKNQDYTVNDPKLRSDIVSLKLTSGNLFTNYDCFYLKAGGVFVGKGDGGFQNMAVNDNGGACKYDAPKQTLTC
ncbi:hypothetical protein KVR01_008485 [Diaporthe batatas]|uniref:uncharacterized protein n=1 Tax=Diaporthe batatas TaxID=748121 RepID=UPI001D036F1E|nr:uncharacterized protein KVR01_008485 [Diaporthe batatas]KAG8161498.1 hypothetical protein KVR01_008485 [Diaporthe batatas]